jgi:peptidoglycan pentaglycine glycine transferase (the first glycine)
VTSFTSHSPTHATAPPSATRSRAKAVVDPARWNQFVAASPYGDVLQCLDWGDVKRPDWHPVPVALHRAENIDATALVLRRAIPRTGRNIFYVPRGPILDWSRADVARSLVVRLREAAKAHKAILIKIDPAVPSSTPGIAATLRALGFQPSPDASGGFGGTQPRCVMKLDISGSPEELMARFHQKWRYNIRLAERKGVTVRDDCTRDDLPIFHDLYRVTAERDGFTGRPLAYFQKLWDVLVEKEMAKLFVTFYQGQPLSAAICFVLPPQCWYVYGASSNEHRNMMPNHAMQWAMMRWARERGCTVYDFRGVANEGEKPGGATDNKGTQADKDDRAASDQHLQGLNRFKAGFGAQLVDYVGEWDLPLDKPWYWLWTTARPRLVAALKKQSRQSARLPG